MRGGQEHREAGAATFEAGRREWAWRNWAFPGLIPIRISLNVATGVAGWVNEFVGGLKVTLFFSEVLDSALILEGLRIGPVSPSKGPFHASAVHNPPNHPTQDLGAECGSEKGF